MSQDVHSTSNTTAISTNNSLSNATLCSTCPAVSRAVRGGAAGAELRAYVGECVDQYFYQHIEHDMDVLKDNATNEVNLSPSRPAMDGLHSVNSAKLCLDRSAMEQSVYFYTLPERAWI